MLGPPASEPSLPDINSNNYFLAKFMIYLVALSELGRDCWQHDEMVTVDDLRERLRGREVGV